MTANASSTPAFTEQQLTAIALLVSGQSQGAIAATLGCSRKTVNRWCQQSEFKAEVERRKQRTTEVHQREADRLQDEEISQFYAELDKYRKSLANAHQLLFSTGLSGLQKTIAKFNDMAEAGELDERSIPAYFSTFSGMIERSLQQRAELLAIDELISKLSDGQG